MTHQKSDCCGADIYVDDRASYRDCFDSENSGAISDVCKDCCQICTPIHPDCWSKKEILKFAKKWTKGVLYVDKIQNEVSEYLLDGSIVTQDDKQFFKDLQQVLKSLPIILGEK